MDIPAYETVLGMAISKRIIEKDGLFYLSPKWAIYDIRTGLIVAKHDADSLKFFDCNTPAKLLRQVRAMIGTSRLKEKLLNATSTKPDSWGLEVIGKLPKLPLKVKPPKPLGGKYTTLESALLTLDSAIKNAPEATNEDNKFIGLTLGKTRYKLTNNAQRLERFKKTLLSNKSAFIDSKIEPIKQVIPAQNTQPLKELKTSQKAVKTASKKAVLKPLKPVDVGKAQKAQKTAPTLEKEPKNKALITLKPVILPKIEPLELLCNKTLYSTIKRQQRRLKPFIAGLPAPCLDAEFFVKRGILLLGDNETKISDAGINLLAMRPILINKTIQI
jgi:hypothetical protein